MAIISQGAEATLTLVDDKVYKERTPKSYRLSQVDDALRLSRTNRERKVLIKAKELGLRVPEVFPSDKKFTLVLEYIKGGRLKDWLNGDGKENLSCAEIYLKQVGIWLATLHNNDILHGDLTTSNVLLSKQGELVLIDFGLSFFSKKIEDKAVDLHLFEQGLRSTHYKHAETFFHFFLTGYGASTTYTAVFDRLEIVRARGKNKH
ncbi:Kae1-associated serine/threonine protein kinase [Candidatus Woesearchaeota archaeon]|nr:Kae1-associated serine/threonine protein kinase [Candidatus Woesearchaeota archaeon]